MAVLYCTQYNCSSCIGEQL